MARTNVRRRPTDEAVEGPWTLPAGWKWRTLGRYVSGGGVSVTPSRFPDMDFQLFSVPNFPSGQPEFVKGVEIGSNKQSVQPDDILLCKINPRINRVWKVESVGLGKLIASTEWIRFASHDEVKPDFLRYFLMRDEVRDYLAMNVSGVGGSLTRIRPAIVDPVSFPLPPKDVQRAIVQRIDALFTEIDDGEAALARARSDLGTWRKALLKAAVTGELTADWRAANPPTETGADLLARILADRRAAWLAELRNRGRRYVELAGSNASSDHLPDGWARATYEQLFEVISDQGLKLKEREYKREGAFPVIDQGALFTSGYTDDRALVRNPETAWIIFGDHTRRFKFVDHAFCVGADGVKLMKPVAGFDAKFAFRALQAAQFEDRGYSRHFQFVRALTFELPPVCEQKVIATLIDTNLKELADAEMAQSELTEAAAILRQSILAAAFRGELVA